MSSARERVGTAAESSRRAAVRALVAATLLVAGCDHSPTPVVPTGPTGTSPSPSTPTPVGPTFTLSGVITEHLSGRPVQGATVWVEPFSLTRQVCRWPAAGCGRRPQTPQDDTSSRGSRLSDRLGEHGANLGERLQRPVRAPVRDDGNGRGRRNVGRDRLLDDRPCRAQRVQRRRDQIRESYLARCSKSPQTAGSRSATSGWGGKRLDRATSWPRQELTRRGSIASAVCHGSESRCPPHRHMAMCSMPRSILVRTRS